jgi:hypothetical protein
LNVITLPFELKKSIGKYGSHKECAHTCRYVITSKRVSDGPQYSIQIRDWKTGNEVAQDDFGFKNTMNAKKIEALVGFRGDGGLWRRVRV